MSDDDNHKQVDEILDALPPPPPVEEMIRDMRADALGDHYSIELFRTEHGWKASCLHGPIWVDRTASTMRVALKAVADGLEHWRRQPAAEKERDLRMMAGALRLAGDQPVPKPRLVRDE